LNIARNVINEIISHARRDAPIEACGYLAGKDGIVLHAFPLRNADESAEHFSFDPAEQFAVIRAIRSAGLREMAVYHSHPASPARPSQEDIRLAFDPGISYVIISLAAENPEVKSFRIRGGLVESDEITVVPDSEIAGPPDRKNK